MKSWFLYIVDLHPNFKLRIHLTIRLKHCTVICRCNSIICSTHRIYTDLGETQTQVGYRPRLQALDYCVQMLGVPVACVLSGCTSYLDIHSI